MFDVAPTELLLVAVVALLVIGPKDLPRAMHFVGKWVGKARGVARQFRSGMDTMIREAELAEMEKQWAAENERIMREHPPAPSLSAPEAESADGADMHDLPPLMVAQPDIRPEPVAAEAPVSEVEEPKTRGQGEHPL
ncbi:Sec-independent protein translocase protein TatB [Sphingomonas sp. S2-65]|uniref:Sec-independent protein translocase protein TatB n=1 Tax=Sphingomonas sp. S2-65 TaxID=2903960 RepID=UPI001F1B4FCE|nr:Sec-independent protein translocase protein TatB [Sphingomonas sp. S2-65]UYY59541.1 Sec-independent protein translocase protein TatB [Sphingomonas sp. S2-65]